MTNNLPKNWCECCIKDVANIQTGKLDANAAVENGNYPFFTCALAPLKINTFSFDGNCIYLPGNGANVGYVGYYQGKFDAYQRTYVLDKIAINERYLYFSILLNWKNYNKNKQFGVATNFIRLGNLENYPINLPPLDEQKRIVEKIEELFSDIDNGIKDLKTAQAQIKQYRQSVLKYAFEGKLYKTSEWKEVKLEDVCQINPKTEIKDMKDDDIVSFLPMTSVKAECNYYTEENVLYSKVKKGYTKFKNGDVLFAKITPCMENGKVCIVDNLIQDIGFGSTEFHILRCLNNIIPKYVYYVVIQQCFRKKAKKNMVGAVGQQRVPADFMKNFDILLPSLPEQQQIVAEIEKRFAVADEMEKAVNDSLLQAEKLKQSILKQAFSGKLVPQNPNDEPAAVLLERIKAAKENSTKGKK